MHSVSVIVATYRREETLKKALVSLAEQNYDHYEILVVDDNANAEWNAKTNAVVEGIKAQYPTLELQYIVNEENCGSAKSRNIGIEKATGEYVTFLDDDDEYLPEKLKNQVTFMQENGLDYSITDLELYFENGKLAEKKTRSYIKNTDSDWLFTYHFLHHMTGTDTMMFKTQYVREIGGFAPIDVGDEFYLMQRAIERGGKFGYLPVCDVRALVHTSDAGLSSGDGKIAGENQLYAHKKKYFNRISRKGRRYIRMRHYAVLAFVEKRRGRTGAFLVNAMKAMLIAPIAAVKLLLDR